MARDLYLRIRDEGEAAELLLRLGAGAPSERAWLQTRQAHGDWYYADWQLIAAIAKDAGLSLVNAADIQHLNAGGETNDGVEDETGDVVDEDDDTDAGADATDEPPNTEEEPLRAQERRAST